MIRFTFGDIQSGGLMKTPAKAAETIGWGPADTVKKNVDLKAVAWSWREGTLQRHSTGGRGSLLGKKMSFRLIAFELPWRGTWKYKHLYVKREFMMRNLKK